MCASLAPEMVCRFYSYSVFKRVSILGWFPVNLNVPTPKVRALQIAPKTK
jgi:hypothetical protein